MNLLRMRTSIFNVEARISSDGIPYIMECSPRGGGNRLCEVLHYATGVDLITAQVRAAVGDPIDTILPCVYQGHWADIMLHSMKDGIFDSLQIDTSIQPYVVECDVRVQQGDKVSAFRGANDSFGTLIMHFPDANSSEYAINNINQLIKVILANG